MYMDTDFIGAHFRHLWGRETTHEELLTTGARIWNLGRLLNLREGFGREDDSLPAILDVPHTDGAAAGKTVGADAFGAALDEYYRVRGWDSRRRARARRRWRGWRGRPAGAACGGAGPAHDASRRAR